MKSIMKIYNPSFYMRAEDIIELDLGQDIYNKLRLSSNKNISLNLENNNCRFSINAQIDDIYFSKAKRLSFIMGFLDPSQKDNYENYSAEYYFNINESQIKVPPACSVKFYIYDDKLGIISVKQNEILKNFKKIIAFEMGNEALLCHFSLVSNTDIRNNNPEQQFYSGCASSIRLYNTEILDGNPNPEYHHINKRCLQIEKILINNTSWWRSHLKHEINILDLNYNIINFNVGLVKSIITIATEPFEIKREPCTLLDYGRDSIYGRLYRTFSLYKGRNFLVEEMFLLMNKDKNELLNHIGTEVEFEPHYRAWLGFGVPIIKQHSEVPDWLLISSIFVKYGYGFATDTHVDGDVRYNSNNDYFWNLEPKEKHRCIHFFMKDGYNINHFDIKQAKFENFESYIGHQWYESILKPIRATLAI